MHRPTTWAWDVAEVDGDTMNRPAVRAVAADASDDRGAIGSRADRGADADGADVFTRSLGKSFHLYVLDRPLSISALISTNPCWRGEGGCSPGPWHAVSAPSTPDNPHAPEASPDNAAYPLPSARPAEPQSGGSGASSALGLHQPRSYRALAPGSAERSATEVLGPAVRPHRTRPQPDPVTGQGGGQPKTEPITGRHPYPAGYRAGVALEHLFAFCLDTTP